MQWMPVISEASFLCVHGREYRSGDIVIYLGVRLSATEATEAEICLLHR